MKRIPVLLCLLLSLASTAIADDDPSLSARPSAEQNHQRMMRLLGIENLRRGADGDPDSEFAANYDEARANGNLPSLPDPLRMDDGSPVASAKSWWHDRRPEIVEHFESQLYGRIPDNTPAVDWKILAQFARTVGSTPVRSYTLVGTADNSEFPRIEVAIEMTLSVPENATGPVPVVLELGFDPEVLAKWLERFTEEQIAAFRGGGPDWREQVAERGWAFAELVATSVQADSGDGLTDGIIGLANHGRQREPEDWGALRAWAWGISRAIDYFERDNRIDASRVAVEGHSRFGKAALVAMAFDRRIAVGFISSSGEGGAKLWRRNFGEQVGNIAGSGEFHWMAGNFLRYAGPMTVNDLPVDAHELIALCAPRPVFISSGTVGDQWVDPRGMFLAARGASAVFELLGRPGLGDRGYPPPGTSLTDGHIAWRQHGAGHTPGPNWPHFLDFAERHFNEKD